MSVQEKYFPLTGGLDMVTPPIDIPPGRLIVCTNYEQGNLGGYTRIEGFERTDGKSLPSDASYWIFTVNTGDGITPASGDRVEGLTSGAYGHVVSVDLTSGTWAGGDAVAEVVVSGVSGVFESGETINIISDQSTSLGSGFSSGFSNGFA